MHGHRLAGLALPAFLCVLLASSSPAAALEPVADESEPLAPLALVGIWKVDLRPTPNADPYFQEFVVDSLDGNGFTGTFYGTPIEEARFNTDWGAIHFAFVTRDGSGPYNHSGVLRGDRLEGLSHSLGRGFLSVWSATPASPRPFIEVEGGP